MIKILRINNLDCANCATKIETKIKKLKSVNDCSVNYLTQKIMIDTNEDFSLILPEIENICKKIEPDCKITV